jgi:hypothetical protein
MAPNSHRPSVCHSSYIAVRTSAGKQRKKMDSSVVQCKLQAVLPHQAQFSSVAREEQWSPPYLVFVHGGEGRDANGNRRSVTPSAHESLFSCTARNLQYGGERQANQAAAGRRRSHRGRERAGAARHPQHGSLQTRCGNASQSCIDRRILRCARREDPDAR